MAESQVEFSGETPRAETQGVDSTPAERGFWPLALEMQCVSPPHPKPGPHPWPLPWGRWLRAVHFCSMHLLSRYPKCKNHKV